MSEHVRERAQRLADAWRKHADALGGCGADIAALGYLGFYANAASLDDQREAAQALTAALAALDILDRERRARLEQTLAALEANI